MLTEAQLKSIMPNCASARVATCLRPLNEAMHHFSINTPLRAAAFLAQLAHESGELRWLEELWGPTPAQRRYEPESSLARALGNTRPGDGKRFKGRGPIQITGRANYTRYGTLLDIDLAGEPEQAADPDVGFAIAGLYWTSNGLNELADAEKFVAITRRINGGTNGLADRQKYYARAKGVLAGGVFGDEPPRPRGARRIGPVVPLDEVPQLPRGSEALRAHGGETGAAPAPTRRTAASRNAAAGDGTAEPAPTRKAAGAATAAGAGKTAAKRTAGAAKSAAKRAGSAANAGPGPASDTAEAPAKRAAKKAPAARTGEPARTAPAADEPGDEAGSVREAVAARKRKTAAPAGARKAATR